MVITHLLTGTILQVGAKSENASLPLRFLLVVVEEGAPKNSSDLWFRQSAEPCDNM